MSDLDWKMYLEISSAARAFDRAMLALAGLYVWECIISLDFDFQFITRQKTFQWPMILYFLNRYLRLLSIISLIFGLNWKLFTEPECQFLYWFTLITANAATALSSMILALRTVAVWDMKRYIAFPVAIIILGHWVLLMSGPSLIPLSCPAAEHDINKTLVIAGWIYTMIFDFIIMALLAVKLLRMFSGLQSRLADLVFRDGLIYFIIAFLTNLVAATFLLLNLNTVMFEFTLPAATIQSIVACRVVMRLNNFSSSGVEMFSTIVFRPGKPPHMDQSPDVRVRRTLPSDQRV